MYSDVEGNNVTSQGQENRKNFGEQIKDLPSKSDIRGNKNSSNQTWIVRDDNDMQNNGMSKSSMEQESNQCSYWNLLHCFTIIASTVALTAPIHLFPQHNVIDYQEYWYEIMPAVSASFLLYLLIIAILRFGIFFPEVVALRTILVYVKIYLALLMGYNGTLLFLYATWTLWLGYRHPFPFCGMHALNNALPCCLVAIWFQFPSEYRKVEENKRRILAFMWYFIWFGFTCFERNILMVMFNITPIIVQPIWAILVPIMRESELWMLSKLVVRSSDGRNRAAELFLAIEVGTNYALWLAIYVGTSATEITCYCVLFVEFVISMYNCYNIVKTQKKINTTDINLEDHIQSRNEGIEEVALTEIFEILTPLAYALAVVIAYYGPNAFILGNIRSSLWEYQEIKDLEGSMTALFQMFAIDLLSGLVAFVVFWKYCSVNFLRECCRALKLFWPHICVALAGGVMKVSHSYYEVIKMMLSYLSIC